MPIYKHNYPVTLYHQDFGSLTRSWGYLDSPDQNTDIIGRFYHRDPMAQNSNSYSQYMYISSQPNGSIHLKLRTDSTRFTQVSSVSYDKSQGRIDLVWTDLIFHSAVFLLVCYDTVAPRIILFEE